LTEPKTRESSDQGALAADAFVRVFPAALPRSPTASPR
jgi:hypothetical protein